MDFIIVSIIIVAAFLYTGNMIYQKYKAVRSGEAPCSCASENKGSGCASCTSGVHHIKTNNHKVDN